MKKPFTEIPLLDNRNAPPFPYPISNWPAARFYEATGLITHDDLNDPAQLSQALLRVQRTYEQMRDCVQPVALLIYDHGLTLVAPVHS